MRFESPTLKFRGAVARAMAQAYERRQAGKEVSETMACPWCKSTVSFTVKPTGVSRGQCTGGCGVRWQ